MTDYTPGRTMNEVCCTDVNSYRVHTLYHLFTAQNIRRIATKHADRMFSRSDALSKGFKRSLMTILTEEFADIDKAIRLFKVPKSRRKRHKIVRKRTAYNAFCEWHRENSQHKNIVGQLQKLWRSMTVEEKAPYEKIAIEVPRSIQLTKMETSIEEGLNQIHKQLDEMSEDEELDSDATESDYDSDSSMTCIADES